MNYMAKTHFCHISPINYLHLTKGREVHLTLAHLVDNQQYTNFYLEEKKKGLAAKARNKELLEAGTFKIISHGTGKFGRVLGEVFVETENGLESVNQILINEGHAYEYDGGKKKVFGG